MELRNIKRKATNYQGVMKIYELLLQPLKYDISTLDMILMRRMTPPVIGTMPPAGSE